MIAKQTIFILILFFVLVEYSSAQNSPLVPQGAKPITISPRVGAVIDSIDIKYYRLFYFIRDINSATAYQIDSGTVAFVLGRYLQPDTLISVSAILATKYLPIYIDNMERISDNNILAIISIPALRQISQLEDIEATKNDRVSTTIIQRDNTEIKGEIFLLTQEGVFIIHKSEIYTWQRMLTNIQYVPFGEIEKINESNIRYFKGNKQLLRTYFQDDNILSRRGTFSTFTGKPIPKELRQMVLDSSRIQIRTDFLTEEQIRLLQPKPGNFKLELGMNTFLPWFITLSSTDWNNQNYDSAKITQNSYFLPLELTAEYFINNGLDDSWLFSARISVFATAAQLSSGNNLGSWSGGIQGLLKLKSIDKLYTSGREVSARFGVNFVHTKYNGELKRIQGLNEPPVGTNIPIEQNISQIRVTGGIYNRFQLSDYFSALLYADLIGQLQISSDTSIAQWGRFGRIYYKRVESTIPYISFRLGAMLQYSL
jgi:hypothetical protein